MWQKTKGIVFNSVKHKENAFILKIYTRHSGLQSFYNSISITSKKNRGLAHMQPLTLLEIEFSEKENLALQRPKEIKIAEPYKSIPFDINKSATVMFLQEVICKSVIENTPNPALFDFMWSSFQYYDLSDNNNNFHITFLAKLLMYIGFLPQKNYSEVQKYFDIKSGDYTHAVPAHTFYLDCLEAKQLSLLFTQDYYANSKLQISPLQRKLLLQALIDFYIIHLQ
jgi:DNA repair protein RecO (recombination protein O)